MKPNESFHSAGRVFVFVRGFVFWMIGSVCVAFKVKGDFFYPPFILSSFLVFTRGSAGYSGRDSMSQFIFS